MSAHEHVRVEQKSENERGVWMKAGRGGEEQSTAETPALETKATVSPAYYDRSQHYFATDGLQ